FQQDGSLDRIETRGHAQPDIVVLVSTLAVHTNAAKDRRQIVVVGKDRSAIAIATKRLGREETRRRSEAKRTQPAPPVLRTEALRRVVEHEQPFSGRDLANGVVIGGLSKQIDGYDGLGRQSPLPRQR